MNRSKLYSVLTVASADRTSPSKSTTIVNIYLFIYLFIYFTFSCKFLCSCFIKFFECSVAGEGEIMTGYNLKQSETVRKTELPFEI